MAAPGAVVTNDAMLFQAIGSGTSPVEASISERDDYPLRITVY